MLCVVFICYQLLMGAVQSSNELGAVAVAVALLLGTMFVSAVVITAVYVGSTFIWALTGASI